MVRILKTTCLLFLFLALFDADDTFAAGRVFYDGFESGTTSLWDQDDQRNRCTVVSSGIDGGSGPYAGSRMARCNWNGTVTGGDATAYETLTKNFSGVGSEVFYRFYTRADADVDAVDGSKLMRIGVKGSFLDYLFARGSSPGNYYYFQSDNGAQTYGYDITGGWPKTGWRKWEIYVYNHTTNGTIRIWINDVLDREWTNVNTYSSEGWSRFYMMSNWENNPGWEHDANNHMYWDEFEVYSNTGTGGTGLMSDGTMVQGGGDTIPPAAPTGLGVQ